MHRLFNDKSSAIQQQFTDHSATVQRLFNDNSTAVQRQFNGSVQWLFCGALFFVVWFLLPVYKCIEKLEINSFLRIP